MTISESISKTNGIVFGKFLPPHLGHLALIDFARQNCSHLSLVVCYTETEHIEGFQRIEWLKEELKDKEGIEVVGFSYNDQLLPNTSESSREVSKVWAAALKKQFPGISVVFTSEPYGEYVAEYWGIKHIVFDMGRKQFPVSSTLINSKPAWYRKWIIPAARSSFVIKVVICGSESTGKSTLTKRLAEYFSTHYVHEAGRDIVGVTDECTWNDLEKIASSHAQNILSATKNARPFLFIDTDIWITRSYGRFLFNREIEITDDVLSANIADFHFYLEPDVPFVQDGTRLNEEDRLELHLSHLQSYSDAGISLQRISGSWQEKENKIIAILNSLL